MIFDIITIFPEIFDSYLNESILKRAKKSGLIKINIHNLREFADDRHKKVDDRPFGGGPGMVFKVEPLVKAVQSILSKSQRANRPFDGLRTGKSQTGIILFSPAGKQFTNKIAADFSKKYDRIILVCGRYEGIDERIKRVFHDLGFVVQELSIGPYVLTGGELPAMILIDSISRQIPRVLGKNESIEEKRFGAGLSTYTRPEIFIYKNKKYKVPEVLLSGDHKRIEEWRKEHNK